MNKNPVTLSNFAMQSETISMLTERRAVRILRADHLGMCFGVRDAIALALEESRRRPLTILGELVHNDSVLNDLRAQGIAMEDRAESVQTQAVMITAHGASEKAMERARARGLHVLQATCPLVHLAHRALQELVREGFHPVIVGQRGHVEVRGLTEDLAVFDLVQTEEDVGGLAEHPRIGVVAQTTQTAAKVRCIVEAIRKRFARAEVRYSDTICQPTKQRQQAAVKLAEQSDVVVVVGGAKSNNTRELAATCRLHCGHVRHIEGAQDLQISWFKGATTVGLTAGTSTPDELIDLVEEWLRTNLQI